MKKNFLKNKISIKKAGTAALAAAVLLCALVPTGAEAAEGYSAREDIFIENYCVEGMTEEEMNEVVALKMSEYEESVITITAGSQSMDFTAEDLGVYQQDPEIVSHILKLGKGGNVWDRLKVSKHIETSGNNIFELKPAFSEEGIRDAVENKLTALNVERRDMTLTSDGNGNVMPTDKVDGVYIDTEATTAKLFSYLNNEWYGGTGSASAVVNIDTAEGDYETYSQVKDLLGRGVTVFETGSAYSSRITNIVNAVSKINGTVLMPGEEFSTEAKIGPFTEENGYEEANSYEMGAVVKTYGGGVCQVSTTLYNAVLAAELEVTERSQHSMIVGYVEPALDAAIAEDVKDFKFINNTDLPIYIEGYVSGDAVVFNIIGHETRDPARTVEYVSEVLSEEPYETDIYLDDGLPLGKYEDTGGHSGIEAISYKIVKVNGEQVSKDKLNSSEYVKSNRSVTIGIGGASPEVMALIDDAYSRKDADTLLGIAAQYKSYDSDDN